MKNNLKIPNRKSEAIIRRRKDNAILIKGKSAKGRTMVDMTLHRKFKTGQNESHQETGMNSCAATCKLSFCSINNHRHVTHVTTLMIRHERTGL